MIKINLLGELKAVDRSAQFLLAGWIGALLLVLVGTFFINSATASHSADLRGETELLETQLNNLKEKTKSVAALEDKKKELTDKLRIIALLKRSKSGPVRVLDDLNMAVPERAWIVGLAESENILKITGFALDNQTVATFMKDLALSDYFEKVDLVESKVAQKEGVSIREFTLEAKINYAGKEKAVATPVAAAGGTVSAVAGASSSSEAASAGAAVAAASAGAANKLAAAPTARPNE